MAGTIQILTGPGAMALVGAGGPLLIDREALGQMIDFLVALHDIAEPEPDLEETDAEDSFGDLSRFGSGPGCMASDQDFGGEEAGEPEDGQ